jgi:hypothetical protein
MRDMLTVNQAAQELGYHPNHVRRLLQGEIIKGEKIGNYWFIPKREIERIKAGQDDYGRYRRS